jgi:phenylalanine-4-hydroxylase
MVYMGGAMNDGATIREYGEPIDPKEILDPPDPDTLQLEAGHPGQGDAAYVKRRTELFGLCRQHRLARLGPPLIVYTAEETRIWREVTPKLHELHEQHACSIYLEAKHTLGISSRAIPQLRALSERLQRETQMHLVPAEGPLAYRTFYGYIAERGFPVTQFIRHGSHPEFTPEPDMIHDCLGHVPPLMNHDYAELLTLIGKAAATTQNPLHVLALKRFSWFSIEFGLIEEAGGIKVFGAGILSSTSEIPFSLLSADVTRRRFVTDEVIETDYDPSRMQDHLFVIPSYAWLRAEAVRLVERLVGSGRSA